jgi:hypothetical protein
MKKSRLTADWGRGLCLETARFVSIIFHFQFPDGRSIFGAPTAFWKCQNTPGTTVVPVSGLALDILLFVLSDLKSELLISGGCKLTRFLFRAMLSAWTRRQ